LDSGAETAVIPKSCAVNFPKGSLVDLHGPAKSFKGWKTNVPLELGFVSITRDAAVMKDKVVHVSLLGMDIGASSMIELRV